MVSKSKPENPAGAKSLPIYRVVAGTECHVRKLGTIDWVRHVTKKTTDFTAYFKANRHHYVFESGDWLLQVDRRMVIRADLPLWDGTEATLPPLGGGIVSPSEAEDVLSKLEAGWR